jgi:hypothetical protein
VKSQLDASLSCLCITTSLDNSMQTLQKVVLHLPLDSTQILPPYHGRPFPTRSGKCNALTRFSILESSLSKDGIDVV